MSQILRSLGEIVATAIDTVLPRHLSHYVLPHTDHFAPHAGTGFEGWYTRIQGDDFSVAIIMCSLEAAADSVDRQHYLHFSIVPLRGGDSAIKERVEIHKFPHSIIPTVHTPGTLPFTLDAPEFGQFSCLPDLQTYELRIPDEESNCIYFVKVRITGRTPLDASDPNAAPHGSFARLESTLPLHWAIFSTCSAADIEVTRQSTSSESPGLSNEPEVILRRSGRAHLEKNWGVSFPQGWTWSQASSSAATPSAPLSLALAGGMILGNKALMIHYHSPLHTWMFAPPYTIILALPNPVSIFRRLWTRESGANRSQSLTSQWGAFTSESYDNVRGELNVSVQNLFQKLVVAVKSTDPPSAEKWLALYCPLPGGHSTTAYETFTATMNILAYTRTWPFGAWKLVESHEIPDAALEFGGAYWKDPSFKRSD